MTYSTEDFVRRAAGGILRGNKYRGKFVCLPYRVALSPQLADRPCLVTMTRERLHPGWRHSFTQRPVPRWAAGAFGDFLADRLCGLRLLPVGEEQRPAPTSDEAAEPVDIGLVKRSVDFVQRVNACGLRQERVH